MLEELLRQLFIKLEHEPDNDKKSKNGNAVYFIEKILEKKFEKFNIISARGLKDYFDKYVNGKENKSGEPNTELKDLMAKYIGFDSFLDFQSKNSFSKSSISESGFSTTKKQSFIKNSVRKWLVPAIVVTTLASGVQVSGILKPKCIVWEIDHYEKVDCKTEFSTPEIKDLNISHFRKLKNEEIKEIFANGKPIVWYGKSSNGEFEWFNSMGVHPITGKQLKPMTKYMADKYIYNKN